jgi:hypothetical protein
LNFFKGGSADGSIVFPELAVPGTVLDCDEVVVPALRFKREERVGIGTFVNENSCYIWDMGLVPLLTFTSNAGGRGADGFSLVGVVGAASDTVGGSPESAVGLIPLVRRANGCKF